MEPDEGYFVAISPKRDIDSAILKQVAGRLGTDEYNVRLLLAGEIPRIIALHQSRERAVTLAKNLTMLGLTAIAGSNLDLRHNPSSGFLAQSIQLDEKKVIFHNLSGYAVQTGKEDIFLILEGISLAGAPQKESKTEKTLNLPATLALGGIPVWSKSKLMAIPTGENEHFLRFYRRTHSAPVWKSEAAVLTIHSSVSKKAFPPPRTLKQPSQPCEPRSRAPFTITASHEVSGRIQPYHIKKRWSETAVLYTCSIHRNPAMPGFDDRSTPTIQY